MPEWLYWITRFENAKPLALVIFFVTFCAIVIYVYGSKKRSKRLESYKHMPFLDDEDEASGAANPIDRK